MVMGSLSQETEVAVIGGGPGGYVAAIRAADLGKDVLLIEERERLGGVCLLEGCIPSKSIISAVELVQSARRASRMGLTFEGLTVNPEALSGFARSVVDKLSGGVSALLKRRGVEVVRGRARFTSSRSLSVNGEQELSVDFKHAIVATGSVPATLPGLEGLGVWSSADALELKEVPGRLIVVGGGYIGLELGLVYAGLGSEVTVVEGLERVLHGADPDLTDVMVRSCKERFHGFLTGSKVESIEQTAADGFEVTVTHDGERSTLSADRVLVAVGRKPSTGDLGLEHTRVELDDRGRILTDEACRTADPNIFAIGDVTPGPMLAHKASREARVAAEVIAEHPSAFDNRAVPAVVFTNPELAWVGLTEEEAKARGLSVNVGRFPLKALGRARTLDRTDGLVKVISDAGNDLILGVGIVGPHASEMIAEATLALEMGATLEDMISTIHPHPTLSEAVMEAAEAAAGLPVHINPPGRK